MIQKIIPKSKKIKRGFRNIFQSNKKFKSNLKQKNFKNRRRQNKNVSIKKNNKLVVKVHSDINLFQNPKSIKIKICNRHKTYDLEMKIFLQMDK